MARIGMNPSRTKRTDHRPAHVTVAVLVHIPHLTGYYEHRLTVLEASLWSLESNTKAPYDLMVFDNGSCREAARYLDDRFKSGSIDYLIRSRHNLGKIGALKIMLPAAPGEVVAYADDDMLYLPGWLDAHLRILDAFPGVGMVSGHVVPSFFASNRIASNRLFADQHPEALAKELAEIPDDWVLQWAESTGREPGAALTERGDVEPFVLEMGGVQAYGAANHDQFVAPKKDILGCLPSVWSGQLMGQMLELDHVVDQAGHLRLATIDRTTQHIGNVVGPAVAEHLPHDLAAVPMKVQRGKTTWGRWQRRFLKSRPIRWLLLGVYSHLFRWINPD